MSALTWGSDEDPAVLAIHGWLDNAASFIPLAEHLSGVHLIALDLPGHGKSEHRTGSSAYYVIDYAADVLLAAEALGLKKFAVLGHSLGGIIGAVLAAGQPGKISRLAMIDGMGPMTEKSKQFPARLARFLSYTIRLSRGPKIYKSKAEAAKARHEANQTGQILPQSAALLAERNLTRSEGGYKWGTDAKLRMPTPMYWTENHVFELLPHIGCESRLLIPDEGTLSQYPASSERNAQIADLEVVRVKGGHHVHMDDPASVAPAVQPFLQRQAA